MEQWATWRRELDRLLLNIQEIQKVTPAPIDQAVDMLGLTGRAKELFLQQPAVERRRLLQIVVEKAAWQDSALRTTLFEPLEILRHSNQESHQYEEARHETHLGHVSNALRRPGRWRPKPGEPYYGIRLSVSAMEPLFHPPSPGANLSGKRSHNGHQSDQEC